MAYTRFTLVDREADQRPTVHLWTPDSPPRGLLVVAHGMGEHALRYARLADAANAAGFAVYAGDHRGHGATVREPGQLGDFGREGWRGLVDDLGAIVERARSDHPACAVVLLGHSMGSMAVQHFITESSDRIAAAALSGTTAVDHMAGMVSDPDEDLFSSLNAAFAPARTESDWLSRDEVEVDRYVADPLCGFTADEASLASLIEAGLVYSGAEAIAAIRKDLPIYVFAGDRDPVGANGALVELVAERYREAGIEDVTLQLYPEARHELLNETNRAEVTADLLAWSGRFLGA
jgi:alpha-beta hydrolase superfamily lysophospholipase